MLSRRHRTLHEYEADVDPFRQFDAWYADAIAAGVPQPDAMALATAGLDGRPSVRMVLLKGADERGFVFHTSYESAKAVDLAANPHAALAFHWYELHRQVRISGPVARLVADESDAYFATRPRGAQIAAAASAQSRVIPGRSHLEEAVLRVAAEYEGGPVPRPDTWGGFRVMPEVFEFWQGRDNRMHDRIRYSREGNGWRIERLSP